MTEAALLQAPGASRGEQWLTEGLDEGFSYSIRSNRLLTKFASAYQDVEVHESDTFGRLLLLDGSFMVSERDEFFYHENLVHVAACTHPLPLTALIIGGGDGGAAEELLKHSVIESVTLVEIDPAVIDVARTYLRAVHQGVIDELNGNTRLHIHVADGLQFVQSSSERFDLIILDLTDPGGPSEPLYTTDFYRACAARLAPGGILSLHVASPFAQQDGVVRTLTSLRQAFAIVRPYMVTVPLSGGPWMMACASDLRDPTGVTAPAVDRLLIERGVTKLQYYNGAMHQAAMSLPNFVRTALVETGARLR